jgi:hypothetical protein
MGTNLIVLTLLGILTLSCSAKEDEKPYSNAPATKPAEQSPTQTGDKTESDSTAQTGDSKFYKVSIPRPAKMCDQEGYKYLYTAYFVNECGGCHYKDNTYGVTPFAVGNDFALSFTTMTTATDKEIVRGAILGNAFCKLCKLTPDDPLAKDINTWLDHPTDCTGL